jgi:GTPase SAR1 family protein
MGVDGWEHRLEKNQILDCLRMINHGTVACHRIRVMLVGACCLRLLVVVAGVLTGVSHLMVNEWLNEWGCRGTYVSAGEGKVGKTSLVKCLKKVTTHSPSISKKIPHIKRKKAPSTIATDGINITEWTVKVHTNNKGKEPEDLSFSAWDFAGQARRTTRHAHTHTHTHTHDTHDTQHAGKSRSANCGLSACTVVRVGMAQEVYYATHQMFINPRSIYVAAFNLANATDSELQRVEYWLQSIQTRARASPVFVVGTHADDKLCSKVRPHPSRVLNPTLTTRACLWAAPHRPTTCVRTYVRSSWWSWSSWSWSPWSWSSWSWSSWWVAVWQEYLEDTRRMLQERYFQQGRFPNIQGPFFISSKTGKGIGKLHHELMKVALLQPHMQVLVVAAGGGCSLVVASKLTPPPPGHAHVRRVCICICVHAT